MRHDRDLPSRIHTAAPTAAPAALAAEPDAGITAIVIPVLLRTRGSLREANLKFLISYYEMRVPALVIVEQLQPGEKTHLKSFVEAHSPTAHYLQDEIESELVHKCRLVNLGARYAIETLNARYIWQVDADILIHPVPVLRNLAILNSVKVPVVKPFLHFARLSAKESQEILHLTRSLAENYDPPSPLDYTTQFETLVGPGSMIFSRHAFTTTGGMDESYSGWGWEDIEFAERLSATLPVHTFPFRAVHLFHEEDRRRNEGNAELFFKTHRKHLSPTEKARVLAHTSFWNTLRKTCLIHFFGDTRAIAFEESFAAHPETTHFFNLFDQSDLQRAYLPEVAGSVVERIAEALGSAQTSCASMALRFPLGDSAETLLKILVASGFRLVILNWPDPLEVYLEDRPELVSRVFNNALCATARIAIQEDVESMKLLRRRFLKMLSTVASSYHLGLEEIAIEPDLDPDSDWDRHIAFDQVRKFLDLERPYNRDLGTNPIKSFRPDDRIVEAARLLRDNLPS